MRKHWNHVLSLAGAIVITFAFSGGIQAQDPYPHGGSLEARQHGYEHGYRDGFERGRDVRARNGNSDFHSQEYERADRGYEAYLGDREVFRVGYREGFQAGYSDGFNGNRARLNEIYGYKGREYDADRDRDHDREDNVYAQRKWGYRDVASDIAYRDGLSAGAKDAQTGHSYRPQEHDSWRDANHGYTGAFGSRDAYKREYRSAYEAGYADGYGARRP